MSFAAMMLLAMAIDALLGWPAALFWRIGHPVTWLGALIDRLERRWNAGSERDRFWRGAACVAVVLAVTIALTVALQSVLPAGWTGIFIGAVLAWPLIALRSMHDHIRAVAGPLMAGDTDAARGAVAMIVGRDPARLDQAGIARAALESLAENSSDGIVAPLFWGVVAGLPGIAAYKAINTLDSMIGHRNSRYEYFGKCAARLDDLVNLIPARLTALLFALVAAKPRHALSVTRQDARHHRSPNAGWPEAAMAGGLGVRLSGPRQYDDRVADEPWVNGAADDPAPEDLERGLQLYRRAMMLLAGILVLVIALGG